MTGQIFSEWEELPTIQCMTLKYFQIVGLLFKKNYYYYMFQLKVKRYQQNEIFKNDKKQSIYLAYMTIF